MHPPGDDSGDPERDDGLPDVQATLHQGLDADDSLDALDRVELVEIGFDRLRTYQEADLDHV